VQAGLGTQPPQKKTGEEPDMFRIDKMVDAWAMDMDDGFQDRSIAGQSQSCIWRFTVPPGQQMVEEWND
jgi:hypothetical protein